MVSSGHIVSQKNNRSLSKFASSRYRAKLKDLLNNSSSKSYNEEKFKPISAELKLQIKKEVRKEIIQLRIKAIGKTIVTILVLIILLVWLFKFL